MNTRVIISAGAGPEEVRLFVRSLAQHIHAACQGAGVKPGALTRSEPQSRSVSFLVEEGAVGWLTAIAGCHVLVARSPKRGKHARKRWFARVALVSEPGLPSAKVSPSDLVFHADRSRGPGGQNVNKRSTAVRMRHRPTGVCVRVDTERSQTSNRRQATHRIEQALADQRDTVTARSAATTRLEHWRLERGRPVCTYELDPRGRLLEVPP